MSRHTDVLIIGGGIVGLACAYYLIKAGKQVRIIEQDKNGIYTGFQTAIQ
jgi:D-amino-acid dehydrogenase